jgi:hypothetical protein
MPETLFTEYEHNPLLKVKEFTEKVRDGAKKGGPYYNIGLALPASTRFEDMAAVLRNETIRKRITEQTPLDEQTLDYLINAATSGGQKESRIARAVLSVATRIATAGHKESEAILKKNHILTGPQIHPVLVYLYNHRVVDQQDVLPHVDRATWYLQPLTAEAQKNARKAAESIFEKIVGSPDKAREMAKHITLDTPEQSNELLSLVSHNFQSHDEAYKNDLARAIFLAKHKPYMGLFKMLLATTSIMTAPHTNYLNAHAAIAPLLEGHGFIGVHPSLLDAPGEVIPRSTAKIQGLIELAKLALDDKAEVPKEYQDAVGVLRSFAQKLNEGVKVGNKTYKLNKDEITPISLASAFGIAQHKLDDVLNVWAAASHLSNKTYALHSIHDNTYHYVAKPALMIADKLDKAGDKETATLLRDSANVLMHNVREGIAHYLKTGDASKLESLAQDARGIQRVIPKAKHDDELSILGLDKTATRLEQLVTSLSTNPSIKESKTLKKQILERLDPTIAKEGYVPGMFGLGPKIGPYGAALAGHTRAPIIDTWMHRLSNIILTPKRHVTGTPEHLLDFQMSERPTLGYTAHRAATAKEVKRVLNSLNKYLEKKGSSGWQARLAESIRTSMRQLGLPENMPIHVLASDSQNQAWVWHPIRYTIDESAVEHLSSFQKYTPHLVNTPDWHIRPESTGKKDNFYTEKLPRSYENMRNLVGHLKSHNLTPIVSPKLAVSGKPIKTKETKAQTTEE